MREEVRGLCEDYEKRVETVQKDAGLHRERLSGVFQDLHQLLQWEEDHRLSQSKDREEQATRDLETKVLDLEALSSSIVALQETLVGGDPGDKVTPQAAQQVKSFRAQLVAAVGFQAGLDGNMSPLQLRQWRGMRHVVKPVPEPLLFNPRTAHPNLTVSPDLRQVRFQPHPNMVVESEHRFQQALYVLGMPGFQSGRQYWEVDVGHKSNWIIGVVRGSVERKATPGLSPAKGHWVLRKESDDLYYGVGIFPVTLKLETPPTRIGVCLDFFRGSLAFYDADTTSLVFQFSDCPGGEELFPFFCPGVPVREGDWAPLSLCA
ncbi:hypothetical protein FKM82_026527 [Ascaphus truei]